MNSSERRIVRTGWSTAGNCGGVDDLEAEPEHDEPSLGALEQPVDQTRWGQSSRTDREADGSESGIGDQGGLDEQVPFRDWQNVGMV